MSETQLVRSVLSYLSLRPDTQAWRCNSGKVFTVHPSRLCGRCKRKGYWLTLAPAGTPDIIGYQDGGRFLGIECKTDEGKLREDQELWLHKAGNRGCQVMVAHSIDEVRGVLK